MPAIDLLLSAQIRQAERLASDARMVGDAEDHQLWKLRLSTWRRDTLAVLSDEVDAETLHTLERVLSRTVTEGAVHEDLPVELEGLNRAVALLVGLREQVARRGAGPADGDAAGGP